MEVFDETTEKIVSGQWSIFVVGSGGFGGKRNSDQIVPTVDAPKRQPDSSLKYKTSIDQVYNCHSSLLLYESFLIA